MIKSNRYFYRSFVLLLQAFHVSTPLLRKDYLILDKIPDSLDEFTLLLHHCTAHNMMKRCDDNWK